MLNKAQLIGHLGADPVLQHAANQPRATVRIATRRHWTDQEGRPHEETQWHDLVFWGRLAESVGRLLRKGLLVYVEGFLRSSTWSDPNDPETTYTRTEVVGETFRILSPRQGEASGESTEGNPS